MSLFSEGLSSTNIPEQALLNSRAQEQVFCPQVKSKSQCSKPTQVTARNLSKQVKHFDENGLTKTSIRVKSHLQDRGAKFTPIYLSHMDKLKPLCVEFKWVESMCCFQPLILCVLKSDCWLFGYYISVWFQNQSFSDITLYTCFKSKYEWFI